MSSFIEITKDQTPSGEFHLTTFWFPFQQELDFLFHVFYCYRNNPVSWHIKEIYKQLQHCFDKTHNHSKLKPTYFMHDTFILIVHLALILLKTWWNDMLRIDKSTWVVKIEHLPRILLMQRSKVPPINKRAADFVILLVAEIVNYGGCSLSSVCFQRLWKLFKILYLTQWYVPWLF